MHLSSTANSWHPIINSYEFLTNAISSVSLAIFGLFISYIFYGSAYSFFSEFEFSKFPCKKESKKELSGCSKKRYTALIMKQGVFVCNRRNKLINVRCALKLLYVKPVCEDRSIYMTKWLPWALLKVSYLI
jgi:hypothetical protein